MKVKISLDEALRKARPGLRYRIEQSVALLRNAESLALTYDPDEGFYLAFSGGKDSQALYHVAELAGVRFRAHFSPTTVDPPKLIKFIRKNYPECEFEKVDKSMFQVAKEMGLVPTMKLRWCCAKFKESSGAGKVTLTGVRHAESIKRAQRKSVEVSGHKFSGDIDEFFKWSAARIEKKMKNINQDEFSREKESEVRCINGNDSIIVNPMIEWTDADVWDFLNKVCEVPHCELYDPPYNQHRIGCILCPMASHKQKLRDIELYPHIKERWLDVFEYYIGGGGTTQPMQSAKNQSVITTRGGQDTTPTRRILPSKPIEQYLRDNPQTASALLRACGRTTPRRNHKKRQTQMGSCLPKDGGQGRAGVSMSAEVLFEWWLTHDSWEEFKAKKEYPKLFDDTE